MPTGEGCSASLILMGLPLLVILAGTLLQVLPPIVAMWLLAWTLFSLPLGIAVGHCALSED
jgi:hypothetical protein